MKRHIAVKFLAILLCAASLLMAVVSGGGLILMAILGLSSANSPEAAYETSVRSELKAAALYRAERYASQNLGGMPEDLVDSHWINVPYTNWYDTPYGLYNTSGELLEGTDQAPDGTMEYTFELPGIRYYELVSEEPMTLAETPDSDGTDEEAQTETVTVQTGGKEETYYLQEAMSPEYTVKFYVHYGEGTDAGMWAILGAIWSYRDALIPATGISLLLFAVLAVYLCCVAGRAPGSDVVSPGGLNRVPLDLYALVSFGGIAGIGTGIYMALQRMLNRGLTDSTTIVVGVMGYGGFACALLFVGFCYCAAAQFKAPKSYWFHNSLMGRAFRLLVWLADHTVVRVLRFLHRWIVQLFSMLPQIWQWILVGLILLLILGVAFATRQIIPIIFAIAMYLGVIVYCGICFARLLESARRMRSGELETKVDENNMLGGFRDLARELNSLAGVVMLAAQKQLKSERMKAELITNVSHDIKTPLTSIINYVDLLQRPHSDQEQQEYLEVLARQSRRMKKLIDDLMELSKASTGNIHVEIITLDAVEAVNQALGEFSDKLDSVGLTPVFHHPEAQVDMRCDGKLFWRAIGNLLGNAVKYAMPGTRLYIELDRAGENVLISLKNISREQISARGEELLERFVRGDSSRNTEGSGLGLNIAKSLLELQGGKLQLLVDGDLFKVTMILPAG